MHPHDHKTFTCAPSLGRSHCNGAATRYGLRALPLLSPVMVLLGTACLSDGFCKVVGWNGASWNADANGTLVSLLGLVLQ